MNEIVPPIGVRRTVWQPDFPDDDDLQRRGLYLWLSEQCRVYSLQVGISLMRRLYGATAIDSSGCWIWNGRIMKVPGYGVIAVGRAGQISTHRASFSAFGVNPIPNGLCVLHRCDVRRCINPAHLFLGTKKDNSQDMLKKGRHYSHTRTLTHCPKGHPYDSVNTYGARTCSICRRATGLRHYYKSRMEATRGN